MENETPKPVSSGGKVRDAMRRAALGLRMGMLFLALCLLVTGTVVFGARLFLEPPARRARRNYPPTLLWEGLAFPTPTPTPVPTATPVPTPRPTPTPTPVPTPTPISTPSPTPTPPPCDEAGCTSGDVELSLFWGTRDDVDFYLETPSGDILTHQNRGDSLGIHLDVDMNHERISANPVEHFVVPKRERLEPGVYIAYVHYYKAEHGEDPQSLPFQVVVKNGSLTQKFQGVARWDEKVAQAICILTVDKNRKVVVGSAQGRPGRPLTPQNK